MISSSHANCMHRTEMLG